MALLCVGTKDVQKHVPVHGCQRRCLRAESERSLCRQNNGFLDPKPVSPSLPLLTAPERPDSQKVLIPTPTTHVQGPPRARHGAAYSPRGRPLPCPDAQNQSVGEASRGPAPAGLSNSRMCSAAPEKGRSLWGPARAPGQGSLPAPPLLLMNSACPRARATSKLLPLSPLQSQV